MSRRLNWERAAARDRQRLSGLRESSKKAKERAKRADDLAQQTRREFVEKHGVECFGPGPHSHRIAKTGWSKRGPWAICASCVARHSEEKVSRLRPAR